LKKKRKRKKKGHEEERARRCQLLSCPGEKGKKKGISERGGGGR